MKKITLLLAALLYLLAGAAAYGAEGSDPYVYEPKVFDRAKDFGLPAGTRLIAEETIDGTRVLLLGDGWDGKTGYREVTLASESAGAPKEAQEAKGAKTRKARKAAKPAKFSMGRGDAPFIRVYDFGGERGVYFSIIKDGVVDARVYTQASGKLAESLRIDRGLRERAKLDVRGTLLQSYKIEVASQGAGFAKTLDLVFAREFLEQEGVYRPDGAPVAALRNLRLTYAAGSDARLSEGSGQSSVEIVMTLDTLSKKFLVNVYFTAARRGDGTWDIKLTDAEPAFLTEE